MATFWQLMSQAHSSRTLIIGAGLQPGPCPDVGVSSAVFLLLLCLQDVLWGVTEGRTLTKGSVTTLFK